MHVVSLSLEHYIHSFIHSFIEDYEMGANDLVMYLKVRLLSCGKVLPKNLLGEIHFPGQRGETPVRVGCPTLDQTFGPSNITCHRIALNLQLQGREINFTWDKPEWHIAFEKQNSCSESISYQSTTWFNSSPKRRFSTSLKKKPSPCGSHSQPSLSSALPIELLWKETAESQTNQNLKVELTATLGHFWSLLLTACKRNDVLLSERRHIWVLNHQYNPEETETDAMHSSNASQGFLQTMKIIMITGMPLSRVHTNAKARQSLLIQASQVQNQNEKKKKARSGLFFGSASNCTDSLIFVSDTDGNTTCPLEVTNQHKLNRALPLYITWRKPRTRLPPFILVVR